MKKRRLVGQAVAGLVAVVILAAGLGVSAWLVKTKPRARPRPRPRQAPLVDVAALAPTNIRVRIEALGTVLPADQAALQAEVGGRIVWVHPRLVEGTAVTGGAALVRIDDRDYRLAVQRRAAELASAESSLRLEMGQQDIARTEWDLLGEDDAAPALDRELALREPQRKAAEAAVSAARAALEEAELALSRTTIAAPFDAVIVEAPADVGDHAQPGVVLARLAATHRYHIRASVLPDQLEWLVFPSGAAPGAPVRVRMGRGERAGRLLELLPAMEGAGRMAQVLIGVDDPLARATNGPALLLNDLVHVDLAGRRVDGVVRVPRTALRDGANLWLRGADGRLHIRPADILWSRSADVFVADTFEPDQRLVTSDLGAPVEGMELAVEAPGPARSGAAQREEDRPDGG